MPRPCYFLPLAVLLAAVPARAAPPSDRPPSAPVTTPRGTGSSTAVASSVDVTDDTDDTDDKKDPVWSQPHVQLGLSTLVGVGLLPRAAFGMGISAGLRKGFFSLVVGGRIFFTPKYPIAAEPGRTDQASLWSGIISSCLNPVRFLEFCPATIGGGVINVGATDDADERLTGIEKMHPFTVTFGGSVGAEFDLTKHIHMKAVGELGAPIVGSKISYDSGAHWSLIPSRAYGVFGLEFNFYPKTRGHRIGD